MEIQVDTQGGSTGGISALGDGLVQLGMSSNHSPTKIVPSTRCGLPSKSTSAKTPWRMVVSPDVCEAACTTLTKAQIHDIYENRLTDWQPVGGPDRRIAFFN